MNQKTKYKLEEASFEITYGCPMNCIHCSSRAGQKNHIFIPKEKIIEMINDCIENCGTTDISFSGGEPFEHPDFWELLEYCKNKNLRTIVYSCGIQHHTIRETEKEPQLILYDSFSKLRLSKLSKYCDKLIISLHGTEKTHNRIMDIDANAFYLATETIKYARIYNIETDIHFVPTAINYKEIKIIYGVCLALKVNKMSILRYVPQGRGLENEKDGQRLNLTKKEFLELNIDMLFLKKISEQLKTKFRIGIPADFTFLIEFFYDGKIGTAKKPVACTGGKTKILVKADGKVQVCPAWKELDHLSAGDIYKENIVDIWENGDTYVKFRELKKEDLELPCSGCIFLESCIGGCSAQRILNTTMQIDGINKAPDPLCFLDLLNGGKYIWKK